MPNTDFSDNHPHFTFDERNAVLDKVREALTSDSALLQDYINHAYKKSESYKFIRMADDLHEVAHYLNHMRVCFIALTITAYIVLLIFFIFWCIRRNRRNSESSANGGRRTRYDYQAEAGQDYRSNQEDQQAPSLRTEINTGTATTQNFMSRTNRNHPPTFMRHGMSMNHSQQTTRLMTEDGTVKHQLPKINAAAGIAELNASCDQQEKPRTTVSSEMEKRNGLADM